MGGAAARISDALGMPFMPWQQQVADVALEVDPVTKKFVYREVGLTVPRQSGKTTLILSIMLMRALSEPRQQIRYTAQTGSDARKKWMDDWLPILKPSPFARYFRPRLTNGHEALLFTNGSHQGLVATTKKTGHGGSIDLAFLDESFAHPDARLEQALKPAMVTRRHPQLWVVSTAGTYDDSPYLWGKVENGRALVEAGLTEGVAYFEWSAPEDADPADEEVWWQCMPALGRTAPIEAVRSDFKSMTLSEFQRAYLNQWVASKADPIIPLDVWAEMADGTSTLVDPVQIAFDVASDRSWASVCAAGFRPDGVYGVEVVDSHAGTAWVAPRLAGLRDRWPGCQFVFDAGGPAASLVPELAQLNIAATPIPATEYARACGSLYDLALNRKFRHLDTPDLLESLKVATKRPVGDAWAWSRSGSAGDITPLVGITLALWAFVKAGAPLAVF